MRLAAAQALNVSTSTESSEESLAETPARDLTLESPRRMPTPKRTAPQEAAAAAAIARAQNVQPQPRTSIKTAPTKIVKRLKKPIQPIQQSCIPKPKTRSVSVQTDPL